MPDIEGIIKITNLLLQRIFGKNIPPWIAPLINWTLLVVSLLCVLWGLLVLLSRIKDVWVQSFLPLFYKPEQKRRQRRRQMFAKHVEYEISRLDLLEDWKDEHFSELEAEVEADGRRKRLTLFPFNQPRNGIRREKSLSKALANSQECFILVEGDPGSGKSVALRHVAQHMAARAKKARSMKSVIPIYVNLKELERLDDGVIDRNLIESFILKSLRRINDRDIDTFLDEEFSEGIASGTWFFLFDSFDELPEVLSLTEADTIIKSYSNAIADFLQGGMNQCRGVIASRQFRGPKHFRWPHFRILALSESRCQQLVHKADLPLPLERDLIGYLGIANQEIRSMTSNPLFLSLLCEHMKSGHSFPENTHTVFETYIDYRLNRDKERILQRFKLDVQQIRTAAENIAFCMVSNTGLGLSPTRANLHSAMTHQGLEVDTNLDTLLDTLEYIKLARSETVTEIGESRSFTFAHRRFQEYFATCVVLRDPTRVSPEQLLTDGRWRETAVVMCQTQPISAIAPLICCAEELLLFFYQNISDVIDCLLADRGDEKQGVNEQQRQVVQHFPWPVGTLHVLALLQEGFASRLADLPDKIKSCVGMFGLSATETGILEDHKLALEVCGISPESILLYMLKKAFIERSYWLKEAAYRQVARLHKIPEEIARGMREAIINQYLDGRLRRERYATRAYLSRLPQPISTSLLSSMDILLNLYAIDLGWNSFLFVLAIVCLLPPTSWFWLHVSIAGFAMLVVYGLIFLPQSRSRRSHDEVLLLRFIMGIILFLNLSSRMIESKLYLHITIFYFLLMIFIINAAVFIPCIYKSIKTGLLVNWIYWTFIPCWTIIWFVFVLYKKIKYILPSVKLFRYINIWKTIMTIVMTILMILALIAMSFLIKNFLFLIATIVDIGFLIVLVKEKVFIKVGKMLRMSIRDGLQWRTWAKSSQKPLTCNELYLVIKTFHYRSYHLRVIKHIRKYYLLVATKETEEALRKLALEVEVYLRSEQKMNTECPILVEQANYETLDEIYLLLEDVRSSLYGNAANV